MKTLEIDLLKLYAGKIWNWESTKRWNAWLTMCERENRLDELVNTRKGLQMGMATIQRRGMVTPKLGEMFCRWTGSIEASIRRIVKRRHLMANDIVGNKHATKDTLAEKRQRDVELEIFLGKESH